MSSPQSAAKSAKEKKKYDEMQKVTVEARRKHNLPESEVVIEDFGTLGTEHMLVTPNFILGSEDKIPFKRVKEIKKGTMSVEIHMLDDNKKFSFRVVSPDSAAAILTYIWKNPVTDKGGPISGGGLVDEAGKAGGAGGRPGSSWGTAPGPGSGSGGVGGGAGMGGAGRGAGWGPSHSTSTWGSSGGGGGGGGYGGTGGGGGGGWGQQQQDQVYAGQQVDLQAAQNIERMAHEVHQMGADTNTELARQHEAIDRARYNVQNINYNLKKADRALDGIHSIGGALKNKMTTDKSVAPEFQYIDRTVKVPPQGWPDEDYEICYKAKGRSGALTYASLRLEKNSMTVISREKGKEIKGVVRAYRDMESVVMRCRPYHMDIRFKGNIERIRLCSTSCRFLCNDLYLRMPDESRESFTVQFELGVPSFDWKAPYRIRPPKVGIKTSDLLTDEKNRADMQKAEQHIDMASHVMKDVKNMAIAMGTEIKASTQSLDQLDGEVEDTLIKMRKVNKRIDNEIKNN